MGSLNKPGKFDCLAKAEPDEPMFVLLARDQQAPQLVELWAARRASEGEDPAKVEEALKCAKAMRKHRYERKGAPTCEYCAEDDVENDEFCEKVSKHIVTHNGFQHWHWCGSEEAVIYDGTIVRTIAEYFSTDEVSNEYCNDEGLRVYYETKAMRARANVAVMGDEPEQPKHEPSPEHAEIDRTVQHITKDCAYWPPEDRVWKVLMYLRVHGDPLYKALKALPNEQRKMCGVDEVVVKKVEPT